MLYYIVGLLDSESYSSIENIQRYLSDKYNLYTDLPTLHLTLEIIEDPYDIVKLSAVISNIVKEYKPFSIKIDGALCFDSPFKSVNLKVENQGILKELIYKLNSTLKQNGFNVRENLELWDTHISLANTNFSLRNWSNDEYEEACLLALKDNFHQLSIITKVELWKPINNKSEMVISSFQLK